MTYEKYDKYQLSLKKGEVMINVSAVDREEFFQRVKDAKELLAKEFGEEAKPSPPDEIPFNDPREEATVPACKFCNGPVWDNRKKKLTPKSPDLKCKDKECGGAAWISKEGDYRWRK